MLRTALGPAIAGFLDDPMTVEVMLNPDGRLWVDRLSEGLADSGKMLSAADGERIVRLVAHHVGVEVHSLSPRVSAELPETGERFEGLMRTESVVIDSPVLGKPLVVRDDVALWEAEGGSADALWVNDRGTDLEGNYVYGNIHDLPYKMRRVAEVLRIIIKKDHVAIRDARRLPDPLQVLPFVALVDLAERQ